MIGSGNTVNNVNVGSWRQFSPNSVRRPYYGAPGYWHRPFYGGRSAYYWSRPWAGYHYGWHSGYWNYFARYPVFWTGAALGSLGDTYVYSNPYYEAPAETVVIDQTLDYSQPIPAPTIEQTVIAYPTAPDEEQIKSGQDLPTTEPPPPSKDETATAANALFDEGREFFKQGKYAEAQAKVEGAIAKLPSDATLHEFRALTLFAQGKYKEAASAIYAVMAAGPGWNWDTMSALYGDAADYSKQLKALETATKDSKEAGNHFLLAYHYLVLGEKDAAIGQLKDTVELQPKDNVSAELLKALSGE